MLQFFFLKFSELHILRIQISHKINLISFLEIAVTKNKTKENHTMQHRAQIWILSSSNVKLLLFSLSNFRQHLCREYFQTVHIIHFSKSVSLAAVVVIEPQDRYLQALTTWEIIIYPHLFCYCSISGMAKACPVPYFCNGPGEQCRTGAAV